MKKKTLYTVLTLFFMSLIIILTLGIATHNTWINILDQYGFHILNIFSQKYAWFFAAITIWGAPKTILMMSIVIIIFLKTTRQQIFFSGTILTNLLLNNILKNIFQRPRPTLIHLVHANGFSFPSGHAMATTSFFLSLGIIYYQITKKKQLPFLFMIIAFTIILSRPILHVHYLSDVLAGTCLAISITLIWKLLCFENPLINSDSSNQKNLLSKSHSK